MPLYHLLNLEALDGLARRVIHRCILALQELGGCFFVLSLLDRSCGRRHFLHINKTAWLQACRHAFLVTAAQCVHLTFLCFSLLETLSIETEIDLN